MEIRSTSACQSWASASSDSSLTHWPYHCRPCVLMPRSCTGAPLPHKVLPHTESLPFTATGVGSGAAGGAASATAPTATSIAARAAVRRSSAIS
ncbi:hypothetical protein ACFQ0O_19725 [Saccharopolyspora spinosporotrichia]